MLSFEGASTASFEKKSYALKLQDSREENIDVSLLGMREDHSWKLNALNTDVSKIREITAAQIWEMIDEVNTAVEEPGPLLEYVELVLDGDYKGLYCLVEPVDEKKLDLDRNDILYKMTGWHNDMQDWEIQTSVDNKWKIQSSVRIRYPKVIADYAKAWAPIRDYTNIFYSDSLIDYDMGLSRINLDNYIDYAIFTMTVAASDNCYKNTYYAAHVNADGTYQMIQSPWDLDYTFGNEYEYGAVNNVKFNTNVQTEYVEEALLGLRIARVQALKSDDLEEAQRTKFQEYGNQVYERWSSYRENILSTENILQLMEHNRQYIMETGAVSRENQRWPDSQVNMDIDALKQYQIERMEWLDEYFSEW